MPGSKDSPSSLSSLALRRELQSLSVQIPEDAPVTADVPPAAVSNKLSLPRRPTRRRIKKMDPNEKIYDHYWWKEVIQEDGDGGKVVVCRKKSEETTEFNYVLKIREKASVDSLQDQEDFRRMLVKMLNIPPHTGVMPYSEVLEDETHYYCVMEKASGGSLLSFLVGKHSDGCIPESEMQDLIREILQALGHIHKQGMLHRDIKPDNIVVRRVDDPSCASNSKVDHVTIIDFDHAETNYTPWTLTPQRSENIWGTTGYNAPETYLGHFSPASDLFSVGVTLYMLMTGKMPYDVKALKQELESESPMEIPACRKKRQYRANSTRWVTSDFCKKVFDKMVASDVDWSCDPWPQNEVCRNFCQSLLCIKPQRRPASVEEALQHKWLAQSPEACNSPSVSRPPQTAANVPEEFECQEFECLEQSQSSSSIRLSPSSARVSPQRGPGPDSRVQNMINAMKRANPDTAPAKLARRGSAQLSARDQQRDLKCSQLPARRHSTQGLTQPDKEPMNPSDFWGDTLVLGSSAIKRRSSTEARKLFH